MSIAPKPEDIDISYTNIIAALNKGERIVYNTRDNKFSSVKNKDAADKLAEKNPGLYETSLDALKIRIETYIKENGIKPALMDKLEAALEKRAKSLDSFWHILGGERRDEAQKELRQIKSAVKAAQQAPRIAPGVVASAPRAAPMPEAPTIPFKQSAYPLPRIFEESGEEKGPVDVVKPAAAAMAREAPIAERPIAAAITTPVKEGEEIEKPVPPATGPPMGIPPPPKKGAALPKLTKFEGEPEAPKIDPKDLNKSNEVLEQEVATINQYITLMTNILSSIIAKLERFGKLTESVTAERGYFNVARSDFVELQPALPQMIEMWNKKIGGEVTIDKGSVQLYTDAGYDTEVTRRAALPKKERDLINQRSPLGDHNKLSFLIPVAYSEIQYQEPRVGRIGEKTLRMFDAENREIIPIEAVPSGTKTVLNPLKNETEGFVKWENAKLPLRLEERKVTADGSAFTQLQGMEKEQSETQESKSGNIGFKDFKTQYDQKKKSLSAWETGVKKRHEVLSGKAPKTAAAPKEDTWSQIVEKDPRIAKQAEKWDKTPDKFKREVRLAPKIQMLGALKKGKVIPGE